MDPDDDSISKLFTKAETLFNSLPAEDIFTAGARHLTETLPLIEFAATSAFGSLRDDDSVAAWSQQTASRWRETLADVSNDEMRRLMRRHHFGATYTGGELISLQAKTVDGSDRAGANGANVGQLEVNVLLKWSSMARSNGETEIQIFAYPASQSSSRAELIRTNAMFTNATLKNFGVVLTRTLLNL